MNGIDADYQRLSLVFLIGVAIALILPVVLIQMFGYGEDTVEQSAGETPLKDQDGETANTSMNNEEMITAPLTGKVLSLSEVPDAVFSSGAMGKALPFIRPITNCLHRSMAVSSCLHQQNMRLVCVLNLV